jgi:hypothetical protein
VLVHCHLLSVLLREGHRAESDEHPQPTELAAAGVEMIAHGLWRHAAPITVGTVGCRVHRRSSDGQASR